MIEQSSIDQSSAQHVEHARAPDYLQSYQRLQSALLAYKETLQEYKEALLKFEEGLNGDDNGDEPHPPKG